MANLSLLNCGDFSGTPALEHVSDIADGTLGGININQERDSGGQWTFISGGIEYRVTGFWKTTNTLTKACVGVSKNRGHWHTTVYDGTDGNADLGSTDNTDPHYTVIVGVDPDGYVHLWYDMHSSALKYRKSSLPVTNAGFGAFGSATSMTGSNETSFSYARPILIDGKLHCFYRAGDANVGDIYVKAYDHGAGTWGAAAGTSTDGLLVDGGVGAAPYWSTAVVRPNGQVCLSWTFRTENTGTTDYADNCAVFWNPSTGAFTKADGTSQTVPITIANADIFEDFDTSTKVWKPRLATDSSGRIHTVYYYVDRFVHRVWTSGSGWSSRHDVITTGDAIFADIVVRESDSVAIIVYRDTADNKVKKVESGANDYTTWGSATILHNTAFTDSNFYPTHDEYQWQENQTYTCPVPLAATIPYLRGKTGLLTYPLGEASGTRRSFNSGTNTTLTDTNTVTSGTGKIGTCAQFTAANSELLSAADGAIFDFTGALTISVWVKLDSKGADRGIIGKWTTATANRSYSLMYATSGDRFQFLASGDGSASTTVVANNFGSPSTGVWYHIIAWHDPTADTINICVNNGTADSAAHSTNIFNSTVQFQIGRHREAFYWDGAIDEPILYADIPTSTDRGFFYNSGNGRQWSELAYIAPSIWSHGSSATVNCNAGDTPSVTVAAWGNLPMTEQLTGTNAASYGVVDNADGTWTITRSGAISAGNETLTLTLANDAGNDTLALTFAAAGTGTLKIPAGMSGGFDRYMSGGFNG